MFHRRQSPVTRDTRQQSLMIIQLIISVDYNEHLLQCMVTLYRFCILIGFMCLVITFIIFYSFGLHFLVCHCSGWDWDCVLDCFAKSLTRTK